MLKKIFSYNVNGLRAAMNKGFDRWLAETQPDVLCIQETKAQPEQLDLSVFDRMGYRHYWFSAEKKGYSGVALIVKDKPDRVIYGMGIDKYDAEGRMIRADYGDLSIISTYVPSGTSGDERQAFKMVFLNDFLLYLNNLRKERPNLIIAGDYNIAHTEADINFPKKHEKMSGFLPEERTWFDGLLAQGYVDTFRLFHSEPNQYSWWSYRSNARAKDLGWRIDYHIATASLQNRIKNAYILQDAKHSDHCPVAVEVVHHDE
ncbi:MAG: exodeoxyribonuclease III [Bacteroidales bacterium]|jgi:exodeoxyribonuclease-3|nr:exodeoxyribonuclease III [Bacteroidales bacterium]